MGGRRRGGRESEKRERGERGYGHEPRPGRAQSTRCKNANRPPSHPALYQREEEKEKREGENTKWQGVHLKKKKMLQITNKCLK